LEKEGVGIVGRIGGRVVRGGMGTVTERDCLGGWEKRCGGWVATAEKR